MMPDHKPVRHFLILSSILLIADTTSGALFTNSVSVDSFVRAAAPSSNYGGAGALSVSGASATNSAGTANGAFDTFIRFNVAAMVTNFDTAFGTNNWVINGAKLLVTEKGVAGNPIFNLGKGGFEVRWITNDNWTEGTGMPNTPTGTGITYTDEGTLLTSGVDASLGIFTNAAADAALSLPLALPAAFVSDLQAAGEVGFYLTAADANVGFTFNSRSFGTASARPYLVVSAVPRPAIVAFSVSGTDAIFAGTNGIAGGAYQVWSTTNVALPLSQWSPVATNQLATNGNFTITATNAADMDAAPQQFFILQTQ